MSHKIIPIEHPELLTREEILSEIFHPDGRIISGHASERYLKNHNLYDVIVNYYSDSQSILETLYRMKNNIDVRPVCKVCGKPVRFWSNCEDSSNPAHFSTYCSSKCAATITTHNRAPRFSRVVSYKQEDITLDLLKSFGFITNDNMIDCNKIKINNLKSRGVYYPLLDLFNKECENSNITETSKVIQMIHKIATGDFARCEYCNGLVNYIQKRFNNTCSISCNGALSSRRYDEKHNIHRTVDSVFPDTLLSSDIELYNKYRNASVSELLSYMNESKNKTERSEDRRGKKSPHISQKQFWAERGVDIEIFYVRDETSDTGFQKMIRVKNCCNIHGDCEFTPVQFNNRVKRRHYSVMCPTCNPFTRHKKVTGPENVIKNILDSLNIEYIHLNKTFCSPYECDFYIPSLNIGFEVNGVQWHYGIENYMKHRSKIERAKEISNGSLYYIWEDDIIQNTDDVYEYIKSIIENPHDQSKHYVIHPEDAYCDYFFVNTHNNRHVYFKNEIEEKDLSHWKCCFVIK